MSLAAGGIGNIKIVEFDKVELSNLNRQILYRTSDVGISKGQACKKTLQDLNPDIKIDLIEEIVDRDNIDRILEDAEFIVEGGQSPDGRNTVNEYCLRSGKPITHCSAQFSYGYVFSVVPSQKISMLSSFPRDHTRAEHTGAVPVNVLSTSIAGSLGAAEVFKWFLGYRENMIVNRKKYFNSLILSRGL